MNSDRRVPTLRQAQGGPSSTTGVTSVFSVDECWAGAWLGPSALAVDGDGIRLATDADPAPSGHLAGTVLPGFTDAHVHLGLVDGAALLAGGIAAVDDLGWDPAVAQHWRSDRTLPTVRFAGAFLTVPGGYPSGRSWAPPRSVVDVPTPGTAAAAVDAQLAAGASFIKVTLNSEAGPVLDDETLAALVACAHAAGTTVVAHTEGIGQAERAFAAGVDRLAHTPWSERLHDGLLESMAGALEWVSTLDIHGWGKYGADFATAQDNLRRFHGFGGAVLYGTDLGNGALPLGINVRELRALQGAGLGDDELVRSIAGDGTTVLGPRVSFIPGERHASVQAWLARAEVLAAADLSTTTQGAS
ncbi:MAG TPA: amidohydrolase [Terrimesophilobacter sp.]|uniref:amidohydrolase n=1 Tax=Terrimesophilobacter sp. TaxID=2906435 RepID=UPI002F948A28